MPRQATRSLVDARPVIGACLGILIAAASVFAQMPPEPPARPGRPFRGLFGGVAQADPSRHKTLDLSLSLLGGYDQNAAAGVSNAGGALVDPRFGQSSGMATASATLVFDKVRNENWLYWSGRAGYRYYPSASGLNAPDYSTSVAFRKRPTNPWHLSGTGDLAYQPFLSLLAIPVFPGAGLPPATGDFGFAERPSLIYGTTVDSTVDLSRRSHLVFNYLFRGFDVVRVSDQGRVRQQSGRAGASHDVTRRVTLGARYAYDWDDGSYLGPSMTTSSQGGEVTFDYRRTLRSRRVVTFGLRGGYQQTETRVATIPNRTDAEVTAGVNVSADIGRSWNASGDYRRGLRRLPGIVDPVFSNDVQFKVTGLIERRLDCTFAGLYSKGATEVSAWRAYDSASLMGELRWAINRTTALRGDYIFYRYTFPAHAALPAGVDRRVNRNAVRIGFDFWLPVYREGGTARPGRSSTRLP